MIISQDTNISKQDRTSISSKSIEVEEFFKTRLKKMYQCPPDNDHAEIHLASSTFGYNPPIKPGQKVSICPCCQLPINTVPLPITISTTPLTSYEAKDQSFFLDSGASMFFTFIKALIVYLIIFFLICCCSPIYMSSKTNEYCELYPDQCDSSWYIRYSPVKFKKTVFEYYYNSMNILNNVMVIISILFFYLYRRYQYKIYGMLDVHNLTQDDFTVFVENIPVDGDQTLGKGKIEALLKTIFQEKINNFIDEVRNQVNTKSEHFSFRNLIQHLKKTPEELQKVKSISLCFDLDEMMELIEQRQDLIQQHLKFYRQRKSNLSLRIYVEEESAQGKIDQINDEYLKQCKEYLNNHHKKGTQNHFIGKAFVSFEFQHYRNYIIHLYERQPELFIIDGRQLYISQAAHPSDIDFFNMKVEKWERIVRSIISYLILVGILITFFFILTIMEIIQQKWDANDYATDLAKGSDLAYKGITFGTSLISVILVYIVNQIFGGVVNYLTSLQRHETKTNHLISIIRKTFPAVLLNSVFMYFILNVLQGEQFLKGDGIVVQISRLMIISGIISIPVTFFQIDVRVKSYCRKYFQGYLNHDNLFQVHYNEINQLLEFDFADRYCFYLVQLYSLLFYSYVTPICVPALIIIVSAHYWIDKCNLLKFSSNTFPMNFAISRVILNIFEVSMVCFTIGNSYFQFKLNQGFRCTTFIALMAALSYAVIVLFCPACLQDRLFGGKHEIEKRSYTESINSGAFKSTYWTQNPATMFLPEPNINRPNEIMNDDLYRKIAQFPDLRDWKQKRQSQYRFQ